MGHSSYRPYQTAIYAHRMSAVKLKCACTGIIMGSGKYSNMFYAKCSSTAYWDLHFLYTFISFIYVLFIVLLFYAFFSSVNAGVCDIFMFGETPRGEHFVALCCIMLSRNTKM